MIAPIVPSAFRKLGTTRFRTGSRAQIGGVKFTEPRAFTVYTTPRCYTPSGDAGGKYTTSTSLHYRVRLFAQIGVDAATFTREIPAGKHFGMVAQGVTIFGEIWTELPRSHTDPVPILEPSSTIAEAEVDLTIAEGIADSSLPSVWVTPDVNRLTAHAFLDTPINPTGILSLDPCVLTSCFGYNAGASLHYLMIFGDSTSRPDLVVPVAAGSTFAIDLASSGGRPFPNGCAWGASSTPGNFTYDFNAAFRVDAEVLYL